MSRSTRLWVIAALTFTGIVMLMCMAAGLMKNSHKESNGINSYEQTLYELSGQNQGTQGNNETNENNSAVNKVTDIVRPEIPTEVPADSVTDTPRPTQVQEQPTPTPEVESIKHVIAIDAGHQTKADTGKEPIGPDASETKIKVSWGATGIASGVPENELTLAIALSLKEELIRRGYEVYMLRETGDVSISDSERAKLSNENAEIAVHIHANADEREGIKGIMAFYPSKDNKYVSDLSDKCKILSENILEGLSLTTEAKNWGAIMQDSLTALNWSTIPAAHVEVGYMSNSEEDKLMQTAEYQAKIVKGLANGIDLYYSE